MLNEADFLGAQIAGAKFEGASLIQAASLDTAFFLGAGPAPTYDANTDFTGTGFDPVAAGRREFIPRSWRDRVHCQPAPEHPTGGP